MYITVNFETKEYIQFQEAAYDGNIPGERLRDVHNGENGFSVGLNFQTDERTAHYKFEGTAASGVYLWTYEGPLKAFMKWAIKNSPYYEVSYVEAYGFTFWQTTYGGPIIEQLEKIISSGKEYLLRAENSQIGRQNGLSRQQESYESRLITTLYRAGFLKLDNVHI